ncbi:MAG: hypothetical protein ACI9YT_000292 [Halobacteriales archaeon]
MPIGRSPFPKPEKWYRSADASPPERRFGNDHVRSSEGLRTVSHRHRGPSGGGTYSHSARALGSRNTDRALPFNSAGSLHFDRTVSEPSPTCLDLRGPPPRRRPQSEPVPTPGRPPPRDVLGRTSERLRVLPFPATPGHQRGPPRVPPGPATGSRATARYRPRPNHCTNRSTVSRSAHTVRTALSARSCTAPVVDPNRNRRRRPFRSAPRTVAS